MSSTKGWRARREASANGTPRLCFAGGNASIRNRSAGAALSATAMYRIGIRPNVLSSAPIVKGRNKAPKPKKTPSRFRAEPFWRGSV